jgi:hypothetical protein
VFDESALAHSLNRIDYLEEEGHEIEIKDFDGDRIQYLKENMQKLEAFYPNWYFNSVVWHAPFKKWVVFTLNKLRLYSLLLKLYDRKGQV